MLIRLEYEPRSIWAEIDGLLQKDELMFWLFVYEYIIHFDFRDLLMKLVRDVRWQ